MKGSFGPGFVAVVFGIFLLMAVPAANAQTMGEYGMQTAASAANAKSAGSSLGEAIRNRMHMPSGSNHRSGGSHTVTVRDSGEEYARSTNDSKSDSTHAEKADSHKKKTSDGDAPWRGSWVRVR